MTDEVIAPQTEVLPEAVPEKTATPEPATESGKVDEIPPVDEKKFTQAELDEIIQKRIAKEAAKAERRALKVYAEKLEGMTRQPVQAETPKPDGKPTMAQFANVENYVEAVADWKLQQREQATKQEREQQAQKSMLSKAESIYSEAEKIQGFDRDEFDALPLTPAIAQAIIDSDLPAKVMAHLTSNPAEVDRIAKLAPARQAAEIGKLEAKISTAETSVQTSKAPAPIKPVGSRGGSNAGDLAKASMEDYIAARAKQGARWAK